jgi:hypothetical protein
MNRNEFIKKYSTLYQWLLRKDKNLLDKYIPNINSKIEKNSIFIQKTSTLNIFNKKELPWDCVPEVNKTLYEKLALERKSLHQTANELNLFDSSNAKKLYAQTLNKLAEYSIMREFLSTKPELTSNQLEILQKVYLENKSLTKTAKEVKVSVVAISRTISRVRTKHNINIPKFYREVKGKPVYNIPEFLR